MSLCICLQFHTGDMERAFKLARYIADLEHGFRFDLELCFVARFDCPHDSTVIDYVRKKMPVSQFTTRRKWSGWPEGPNGMAYDLLDEMVRRVDDGRWTNHDAIMFLEPDCVPLSRDWTYALTGEWKKVHRDGAVVMGARRESGGANGHINGNMLIDPLLNMTEITASAPSGLAWDCALVPYWHKRWHKTDLILNLFGETAVPFPKFLGPVGKTVPPVLVHGVKDDSAWDYVKTLLLP